MVGGRGSKKQAKGIALFQKDSVSRGYQLSGNQGMCTVRLKAEGLVESLYKEQIVY